MKKVSDPLGKEVHYSYPPQRIISLCPSITETLFELGLEEQVVGRTRYCIHPESLVSKVQTVGGTKKVNAKKIAALQPDLIIAEKEENPREIVETLSKIHPVYTTEVKTYNDALTMIKSIGKLIDRETSALELTEAIERKFRGVESGAKSRVAYLIWKNPYMAAGQDTYIHSMLERAGLANVFGDRPERYPEITMEDLSSQHPDAILLASEPFPFQEKHCKELQEHFPKTKVMKVDGEICWYGSRMIQAAEELNRLRKIL